MTDSETKRLEKG